MSKWLTLARTANSWPIVSLAPIAPQKQANGPDDTNGHKKGNFENDKEPDAPKEASVGFVGGQGKRFSQNDAVATASPTSWWLDMEEVCYRFEEAAAIREYDEGLPRHQAEEIAAACLVTQLEAEGLPVIEARAIVERGRLHPLTLFN